MKTMGPKDNMIVPIINILILEETAKKYWKALSSPRQCWLLALLLSFGTLLGNCGSYIWANLWRYLHICCSFIFYDPSCRVVTALHWRLIASLQPFADWRQVHADGDKCGEMWFLRDNRSCLWDKRRLNLKDRRIDSFAVGTPNGILYVFKDINYMTWWGVGWRKK